MPAPSLITLPKLLLAPCNSAFLTTSLGSRLYHPVAVAVKTIFCFLSEVLPSLCFKPHLILPSCQSENIFLCLCTHTNYVLIMCLVVGTCFLTMAEHVNRLEDCQ